VSAQPNAAYASRQYQIAPILFNEWLQKRHQRVTRAPGRPIRPLSDAPNDYGRVRVGTPYAAQQSMAGRTFVAYAIAAAVHITLIAMFAGSVAIGRGAAAVSSSRNGIGAFVIEAPRPIGTSGRSIAPRTKLTPARVPAGREQQSSSPTRGEPADSAVSTARGSPTQRVRMGANLGLIKKVDPVYPAVMAASGTGGVVVLDAIIRRDGTIGDVTVLRSSNPAFEPAAIEAVKQWRYTPLPYEGVVTVTVNFMPR
jgi:protein TonB